jgi:hypothetical protein
MGPSAPRPRTCALRSLRHDRRAGWRARDRRGHGWRAPGGPATLALEPARALGGEYRCDRLSGQLRQVGCEHRVGVLPSGVTRTALAVGNDPLLGNDAARPEVRYISFDISPT